MQKLRRRQARRATFLACVMLWSALSLVRRQEQEARHRQAPPTGRPAVDQVLVQLKDAPPGPGGPAVARASRAAPARRAAEGRAGEEAGRGARRSSCSRGCRRWSAEKDDKTDFALREKSQPPPQTGNVDQGAVPAAADLADAAGRRATRARSSRCCASRPRARCRSRRTCRSRSTSRWWRSPRTPTRVAQGVPVKLSPQPKGKWRWIGSKTILFDPEVRFPEATEYTVEIPAGTKSASGAVLEEAGHVHVRDPAADRDPDVAAARAAAARRADVRGVRPEDRRGGRCSATIQLKHGGGADRRCGWRRAEEIEKDTVVKSLHRGARTRRSTRAASSRSSRSRSCRATPTSRWRSARARRRPRARARPRRRRASPSAPSARSRWSSGTARGGRTARRGRRSRSGSPTRSTTRSSIRTRSRIEPELPGLKAVVSGDWLSIHGRQQGAHHVQGRGPGLDPDQFEQTLGKDETLHFQVGDAHPQLFGPTGLTCSIRRARSRPRSALDQHPVARRRGLQGRRRTTGPASSSSWRRTRAGRCRRRARRCSTRSSRSAGSPDEMVETRDRSVARAERQQARPRGRGRQADPWPDRYKPELNAWVQSTEIALDAFVDADELIAWATNLHGRQAAAPGVELALTPAAGKARTGDKGTATLALPKTVKQGTRQLLIGQQGRRRRVPAREHLLLERATAAGARPERGKQLGWFVYDDRHMYKPGEKVRSRAGCA